MGKSTVSFSVLLFLNLQTIHQNIPKKINLLFYLKNQPVDISNWFLKSPFFVAVFGASTRGMTIACWPSATIWWPFLICHPQGLGVKPRPDGTPNFGGWGSPCFSKWHETMHCKMKKNNEIYRSKHPIIRIIWIILLWIYIILHSIHGAFILHKPPA